MATITVKELREFLTYWEEIDPKGDFYVEEAFYENGDEMPLDLKSLKDYLPSDKIEIAGHIAVPLSYNLEVENIPHIFKPSGGDFPSLQTAIRRWRKIYPEYLAQKGTVPMMIQVPKEKLAMVRTLLRLQGVRF